ncbi:hypothetical protein [Clostridium kluyveri]|nr:hypothetical protein [Clostridium kluyveri]
MDRTLRKMRKDLKESGLTISQVLELLNRCKSEILSEMPIDENMKSKLTW